MKINVSVPIEITTSSTIYVGAMKEVERWSYQVTILGQPLEWEQGFKSEASAIAAGKRFARDWAKQRREAS